MIDSLMELVNKHGDPLADAVIKYWFVLVGIIAVMLYLLIKQIR